MLHNLTKQEVANVVKEEIRFTGENEIIGAFLRSHKRFNGANDKKSFMLFLFEGKEHGCAYQIEQSKWNGLEMRRRMERARDPDFVRP